MSCPLCHAENEHILWQTEHYRIIAVHESPLVPAFCRVIWQAHQAEMTDLSAPERMQLMNAVWITEAALRTVLNPAKINLASLGNVVPHLHWHVVARFHEDAHFPAPIWAAPQRQHTPTLPENWLKQVQDYLHTHLTK